MDMSNKAQEFAISIKKECMNILQGFQNEVDHIGKIKLKMATLEEDLCGKVQDVSDRIMDIHNKYYVRFA